MSLANGPILFGLPGPTPIPDRVLRAMQRQPIDIYDPELQAITRTCKADLADIIGTSGNVHIYAANGHGAWEAALVNTLSPGDCVLVLESGRFASDWGHLARDFGLEVRRLPGDWRTAVDPSQVEAFLRDDARKEIKAVLVTQIDTASGVANDIAKISAAIASSGHPALFMVDVIGSLGSVRFQMDAWHVDVAVAGSQKGLMCPPGLSFVAAGVRALERHARAGAPRHYWDWTGRNRPLHYFEYCGTPPEHLLFALREALDIIAEEGLPAVLERHRILAGAVRSAAEVWAAGSNAAVSFNVIDAAARADSVTTLLVADGHDPAELFDFCKNTCGLVMGTGIGVLKGKAFRIAHMGHINAATILGTLATIELGLTSLNWPVGSGGVNAAIAHLAKHTLAKNSPADT
jgi:alanine-glyoxylate transaminase/serine-glyoxylate transaminase/serine-pyruvate transaminase